MGPSAACREHPAQLPDRSRLSVPCHQGNLPPVAALNARLSDASEMGRRNTSLAGRSGTPRAAPAIPNRAAPPTHPCPTDYRMPKARVFRQLGEACAFSKNGDRANTPAPNSATASSAARPLPQRMLVCCSPFDLADVEAEATGHSVSPLDREKHRTDFSIVFLQRDTIAEFETAPERKRAGGCDAYHGVTSTISLQGTAPHSGCVGSICVGPDHALLSWEGAASGCLTVAPILAEIAHSRPT